MLSKPSKWDLTVRLVFLLSLLTATVPAAAQTPSSTIGRGAVSAFTVLPESGAIVRAGPWGAERAPASDPLTVAWSNDLNFVHVIWTAVSQDESTMVLADPENGLIVLDLENGNEQNRLPFPEVAPSTGALSPDGSVLALAFQSAHEIHLLDVATGAPVGDVIDLANGSVITMAYAPSGDAIAFGLGTRVAIVDLATGVVDEIGSHDGAVMSVRFSSDGSRILSGGLDGSLRWWNSENGTLIRTIDTEETKEFEQVAISADNAVIAGLTASEVRFYSAADDTLLFAAEESGWWLRHFLGFVGPNAFVLHEDGSLISLNPSEQTIDQTPQYFTPPLHAAFHLPAADRFVTGHGRSTSHGNTGYGHFWEGDSGEWIAALARPGGVPAFGLRPGHDGTDVVLIGGRPVIVDVESNTATFEGAAAPAAFSVMVMNASGTRIHAVDELTRELYTWEVGSADAPTVEALDLPPAPGTQFRFADDGERLAVSRRNSSALIYDLDNISEPSEATVAGAVATGLSADGSKWVLAHADGSVSLFTVDAALDVTLQHTHETTVTAPLSVAISPDGSLIAVGGADGRVAVLDAATGESRISTGFHRSAVAHLSFATAENSFISAAHDGRAAVWRLSRPSLDITIDVIEDGLQLALPTAPETSYLVQSSTDLVNWQIHPLLDADGEPTANPVVADEFGTRTFRINEGEAPRFYRVMID